MPKFSEIFFGRKEENKQIGTMTPEQQGVFKMLLSGLDEGGPQLFQYLSGILSGESKDEEAFARPFMRQFEEETIPGIAERFGGVGAQSSSGFQRAMGKAGAGLQENLASLRAQLRSGAASQLQGLLGQGMGVNSFENIYHPRQQGFLDFLSQGLGEGLGKAGAAAATGGAG